MTPFAIRWVIDDTKLLEQRPSLDRDRIFQLYFEDARQVWGYVLQGWPTRADGRALRLPGGAAFGYLAIRVVFDRFTSGNPNDVARVDVDELRKHLVTGPGGELFPSQGTIRIDLDDLERLLLDRPRFKDTVVHEIGHVLGLGTLFGDRRLVRTVTDHHARYLGTNGCRAYAELLGRAFGASVEVPLQTEPGGTTPAYHWDERALPLEIMSTELDQPGHVAPDALRHIGTATATNVISPVSAGALKDLGYVVDLSKAQRVAAHPVDGGDAPEAASSGP